jgi:glycosyltransferase involved in cell wall biosynthesis
MSVPHQTGGDATDAAADDLVSVVIAAYNAADFIEETCRSVLLQTYSTFELIVVDDGSKDQTAAIVQRLAREDARVRLVQQANAGVANARNAGIAIARGVFIGILDADDLWDPTKLARQVARLNDAGPEAALAYCWWVWIDEQGKVLDRSPRWSVEGHVLEQLVEVNFIGNTSVPLFRRSALVEAGGYDAGLRDQGAQGSEDWDLALRLAERYQLVAVRDTLVGYRRRARGMSAACDTMWRSRDLVMRKLLVRQPALRSETLQRSDRQYALYLAGVAYWSGRFLEALKWALWARPWRIGARMLPYVARLFVRRLGRAPGGSIVMTAGTRIHNNPALPEPLMPYDRIYEEVWSARPTR